MSRSVELVLVDLLDGDAHDRAGTIERAPEIVLLRFARKRGLMGKCVRDAVNSLRVGQLHAHTVAMGVLRA